MQYSSKNGNTEFTTLTRSLIELSIRSEVFGANSSEAKVIFINLAQIQVLISGFVSEFDFHICFKTHFGRQTSFIKL